MGGFFPAAAVFPSPERYVTYQTGNNLIFPGQGEFGSDIPTEEGKISNLFYSVEAIENMENSTWRPDGDSVKEGFRLPNFK